MEQRIGPGADDSQKDAAEHATAKGRDDSLPLERPAQNATRGSRDHRSTSTSQEPTKQGSDQRSNDQAGDEGNGSRGGRLRVWGWLAHVPSVPKNDGARISGARRPKDQRRPLLRLWRTTFAGLKSMGSIL